MSYRGVRNWPPVWTLRKNRSVKTLMGEVGVLKYVHSNTEMSNKCFLVIDFQSKTYVGSILCRDHSFCTQISDLLRDHIGRPIIAAGLVSGNDNFILFMLRSIKV
jgi:hypothetical protein